MNRLRDLMASVEAYLARLSQRERTLLAGVAGFVLLSIVGLAGYGFSQSIRHRQASIETKTKALAEIGVLAGTYHERDRRRQQLEERLKKPVKLFTFIDDLSKKQGIEIGDMQDRGSTTGLDKVSETLVEFDVNKLTLDKLTSFVNAIEHGPNLLRVKKIRVRTRLDDPNAVDASLTIATYSTGA